MAALYFQKLTPREEIRYLREVLELRNSAELLDRVIGNFHVLQARSSMLLSLVTLCLTISGFSGHRIAGTGPLPAVFLSLGLALAVLSGVLLLMGPLRLRWATRFVREGGVDETLEALLELRNIRTRRYHFAALVLVTGLSSYVFSLILSVFLSGGAG